MTATPQVNYVAAVGDLSADVVLVAPYFADDDLPERAEITHIVGERLAQSARRGETRSTRYEMSLLHGDGERPALLLVGAGSARDMEPIALMRIASAASRYITGRGYQNIAFLDRGLASPQEFAHASVEGAIRGTYDNGLKKTGDRTVRILQSITLVSGEDRSTLESGSRIGVAVGEASSIARDLVNLPPNDLTPTTFAERAVRLGTECGLRCEVLDEGMMRELGMGSLLGVASGSAQPPRLIVMRYGNDDAPIKLALVGKGLTFDSGGLSLKTAEGMETMKGDMGGGAAVVAGMVAIARLTPDAISVTGYVGATENMPGGAAMRPGDVLTAMSGETIEVLNTDAEGRLVLADVLCYAERQGATHIVDFATLTGGAVVALGHEASLATGKPPEWVAEVVESAGMGLERAWQMPLYEEYRRAMDSDVADIKNTGGREGSALTAAAFLSDFVDGPRWTHMDIAGTAFADKATPFQPTGGTGEGVGTIVSIALRLAKP